MEQHKCLTLQTIGDLDRGKVALAFNHALRVATLDVLDRPADKTARKVTLTVELRPKLDKHSAALDVIENEFIIKTTVPNQRSASYPMVADQEGRQIFKPGSPFDPRQGAFPFADEQPPAGVNVQTGEVIED